MLLITSEHISVHKSVSTKILIVIFLNLKPEVSTVLNHNLHEDLEDQM